jgi:hypothetical protein
MYNGTGTINRLSEFEQENNKTLLSFKQIDYSQVKPKNRVFLAVFAYS